MTLILYIKTASIGGGLNAITSLVYSHSKGNSNVLFLMQQTTVTTQPPHLFHHLQSKMAVDGAVKRKHPGKFWAASDYSPEKQTVYMLQIL